ncbi:hypothetical protein BJ875DRAFT_524566 [Amylocarpus encephaloides]|uniref:Uncharacterized protein n=1 Tax=Amylocarpus encephaloides TaxID=45428 RepID=A0A9P7Y9B9_9HELO|nr:hypothetical protein BJ875DRAFT_524566 [Amylocarpus encephaloides]
MATYSYKQAPRSLDTDNCGGPDSDLFSFVSDEDSYRARLVAAASSADSDDEYIPKISTPRPGVRRSGGRRLVKKTTIPEIIPKADTGGWLLGIKYEKLTQEPNRRLAREQDNGDFRVKGVPPTREKSYVANFVVHVIRDFQTVHALYQGVAVEVRSTHLFNMIKNISPYYSAQSFEHEPLLFSEPQRFLFHNLLGFKGKVADTNDNECARKHAQILITCLEKIDSSEDSVIKTMEALSRNTTGHREISFRNIWAIYKPETNTFIFIELEEPLVTILQGA